MRIALLKMESHRKGGLEKYASRIASAFAKRGADVTLLTTSPSKVALPGIDHSFFPVCRWPGFLRLEQFDRQIRRWLKMHPVDIVFGMERNRVQTHIRAGNGVHAAFLKSRIASEGWVKYGLCQINPLHRKILELEKEAFEHFALRKIFVNSQMVRNEVLSHYRVDPAKIEVIYNGVEWNEYASMFAAAEEGKRNALKNFGLTSEAYHLLFIGNGYRRKGLKPLLEALSVWNFKDFHLSVVGHEKNIDLYRSLAARLGLGRRVRFFGPQDETVPFYQIADVLCVPSYYDPFANVTLEALSFGLFVVSSRTNGGHEILTEGNGCVIEDLQSTESILAALDQSRKTAKSKKQIRASAAPFDFSNQLERLIDACL